MKTRLLKAHVCWIGNDGKEVVVGERSRILLAPDVHVDLRFSRPTNSSVCVELSLSHDHVRRRRMNGTSLRFFVVPQQFNRFTVILGNASRVGIRPVSFHPQVTSSKANGAHIVLARGPFKARGPKDHGFFRMNGPKATWLEVSLGPWWGGYSVGAAAINVETHYTLGTQRTCPALLARIGPADGNSVHVTAALVTLSK